VRRRYRLSKGGNPQLMLVHYTRGPATREFLLLLRSKLTCPCMRLRCNPMYRRDDVSRQIFSLSVADIPPALMNQPVRANPTRSINEPPMYVAGEKMGQKVYPPGVGPIHGGPSNMVPPTIGMGMNFNQQQAMLAQQNNNMEALEQRRRERERQQQQERAAQRPPPQRMVEDEDSGGKTSFRNLQYHELKMALDEVDSISTRTLALARYKRNHDWMNDVFNQAAFGTVSSLMCSNPSVLN
jgi:hypothetical protein